MSGALSQKPTSGMKLDWERICDLDYWHKRLNRKFGLRRIVYKPMRADKDTRGLTR